MKKTIAAVVMAAIGFLFPAVLRAAGDGVPLPAGGGEPGKALMAFLDAAHRKDLVAVRAMYPEEASGKITDKELEQSIGLFIMFDPSTLRIAGGVQKGDSATLSTASHGTITMRRTSGKWLMERWESHAETTVDVSVGAEVKFGEGVPAPPPPAGAPMPDSSPEPDKTPEPGKEEPPAAPAETSDSPKTAAYSFDPGTLKVLPEEEKGGRVVVALGTGEEKELFHHVNSHEDAAKAAAILRHYGVNEVVELSMPGEIENFYLKSGKAPSGSYKGDSCTTFDPAALAVKEFTGKLPSGGSYTQWSLDAGKQTVTRFNQKPFAEEMASILKKYGFTHRCRAGTFWYFRR